MRLAGSLQVFPFELVLMLGDNIYGSERPQDFVLKFEKPYAEVLARKIPFYASLGNHDDPNQRFYQPFNMNGKRFYSFEQEGCPVLRAGQQLHGQGPAGLAGARAGGVSRSLEDCVLPPSPLLIRRTARIGGRPSRHRRTALRKARVGVVFAGHEHFYERLKPQHGIHYFTSGGAAKLRAGNIRPGPLTAKGFDSDYSYMLVEIDGEQMHFQTLSRRGQLVDSGTITPEAVNSSSQPGGAEP